MISARITNATLAVWLGVSAFLGFSIVGNILNAVTVGSVVAGAGFALAQDSKSQGRVAGLLGIWLILAALLPSLQTGGGFLLNSMVVGLALLSVSIPYRRQAASPLMAPAPGGSWVDTHATDRARVTARPAERREHELAHHH